MRSGLLIFALTAVVTGYGCGHLNTRINAASTHSTPASAPNSFANRGSSVESASQSGNDSAASPTAAPARVDFPTQIKPILQAKCQPCHFNGGKVYAQMPFDRPETIKTLGTKLFTRIKDENERRLIRDFLAQE